MTCCSRRSVALSCSRTAATQGNMPQPHLLHQLALAAGQDSARRRGSLASAPSWSPRSSCKDKRRRKKNESPSTAARRSTDLHGRSGASATALPHSRTVLYPSTPAQAGPGGSLTETMAELAALASVAAAQRIVEADQFMRAGL